jgi:hypothetical protein
VLIDRDENGWLTGYGAEAKRIYAQTYWLFLAAAAVSVLISTGLLVALRSADVSTGLALVFSLSAQVVALALAVVSLGVHQHRKLKALDDTFREDSRAVAFRKAQQYLERRQQDDHEQS